MKVTTSKLVKKMVSKTLDIKNKMLKNGHEELKNEDLNQIATARNKIRKSKNTNLLYLKSQLTSTYRPLSI